MMMLLVYCILGEWSLAHKPFHSSSFKTTLILERCWIIIWHVWHDTETLPKPAYIQAIGIVIAGALNWMMILAWPGSRRCIEVGGRGAHYIYLGLCAFKIWKSCLALQFLYIQYYECEIGEMEEISAVGLALSGYFIHTNTDGWDDLSTLRNKWENKKALSRALQQGTCILTHLH